jgi:hypothetical protein
MKWSYSAFNAQGSRLIIVVVQLAAMKLYVAAAVALRKKERKDNTQFTTKFDGFLSFHPPSNAIVHFCTSFLNLTLCMTKLRVLVLCFSYFADNSTRVINCPCWTDSHFLSMLGDGVNCVKVACSLVSTH